MDKTKKGAVTLEEITKRKNPEAEEEERICGHCGGTMGTILLGDETANKCFDCGYASME